MPGKKKFLFVQSHYSSKRHSYRYVNNYLI
jgi:hypothetical protein